MNEVLNVIEKWDVVAQWTCVMGLVAFGWLTLQTLLFYATVILRGWPDSYGAIIELPEKEMKG